MTTMIPSLHEALDLAIDLATLGEYGLASQRSVDPGRRGASARPAAIHRVCLTEGRSSAARGGGPDPRVAPVTAAARRRGQRGAAQLLATQALERQRRLGASVHARRPPAPVASLEAARRRRAAERPPAAATHEQLALDVAAIA